ncbi:hypothetical protein [Clostridium chauvoei]|uniref:hypothetical protein n=1 Tax=Clostridium chauvoei TaxID=46867 RepID=UPI000357D815|nr:hypothetical protein [Clostridium chauvoei]MBX7319506.1 hypothetical protein [Clostridium chauvoei]MBX7382612.1 hypothetical protein [Clostridium chauvoei]MBX7390087.1 hypothetical protein [Clostridium chauvoei]CDG01432.1 Putative oxygen-independent coproporphyrinogen III oxidase [Clostridium chauvoei JF4335]
MLEDISRELKLKRTSLWTFGEKDIPKYSSITRDSYLGFGASAATLYTSIYR